MGKSHFVDLRDSTGRIQVYMHAKEVGPEVIELFKLLDLGDFIGVEGDCFLTKTGEPTLESAQARSARRNRSGRCRKNGMGSRTSRLAIASVISIWSRTSSRATFSRNGSRSCARCGGFMEARGFLEVETPMLQAVAGGAAAEPFRTHHNALGLDLYLRIAPELYLKRLLVGGFNKVFELNRNFRNEGISRRHNPEFTMLEGLLGLRRFREDRGPGGGNDLPPGGDDFGNRKRGNRKAETIRIEHKDAEGNVTRTINLTRPWRRARYRDLIREIDPEWFNYTSEKRRERCGELGVEINPRMADYEVTQQVFEKLVEEKTFDPLFVTHCPKELVPLAKQNVGGRFARGCLRVDHQRPGNFARLFRAERSDRAAPAPARTGRRRNAEARRRFPARARARHAAGRRFRPRDRSAVMLLTGAESIRDVILFPQLKPKRS